MINLKWHILQLFADGGASGAPGGADGAGAAATGVEGVDAGHQRLRDLGVPESKIRKRAYAAKNQAPTVQNTAPEPQVNAEQQAAAAETNEPTEEKSARMSWDEIKKDPEYNAEIQKIVQSRLKEGHAAQAAMATLSPWLKELAKEHGLDPEAIDYETLVKSASGEYEKKAMELGVSKEIAMQLDQQQRTLEQQRISDHIQRLEQQGEVLRSTFPTFDLQTEMRNPTFARMVSPNMGMSVEDAYYAVHRREIQAASMQVAAQKTAQQISNAIQSGSRRPDESGTTAQAPSVTMFDYTKASKAEREALKARIRRGEKIYPGQV